jgi:hypothetical protein
MASTDYVPTPNFGAYVNAPAYPGTTTYESAAGTSYYGGTVGATVEVTADFNKDGKPDIAVIQENGTLNILFNDGNGGLQAPVSYINPNYMTSYIFCMYAADVNGDGSPDIVAFDMASDSVLTWLNLGNGTFGPVVTTLLDSTYGVPSTIAVADVNGDGKADLIYIPLQYPASPQSSCLEVQLGAGDGTFGAASAAKIQKFSIAAGGYAVGAVTLADLNGDGKPDLAVSLEENFTYTTGQYVVTTALGNGDGTFSPLGIVQPISLAETATQQDTGLLFQSTGLSLVDVNGDGKLDIVSDVNGVIVSALGSGSGTFGAAVTSNAVGIDNVYSSLVMDVNGDGKADFLEAGQTLGVFLGNGDGTFNPPATGAQWVIDPPGGNSLVAADFNGDGIADVAQLGSTTWDVSLFFGTGKSFVGAPDVTAMGDPNGFYTILASGGNYTASGYISPLFLYDNGATSNIVTGVSDGKGNFISVPSLAGGIPPDLEYVEPIRADLNGDGLDDLVYATVTGDLKVALGKGDGTFATPVPVGLPAAACPVNYAAAGDINGDGKVDLVIPYGGDQLCGASGSGVSGYYVALGRGDGTFSAPVFTATGIELYSLTLADFNNDGQLDLILNDGDFTGILNSQAPSYGPAYTISVAMGHGDGTFANSNPVLQNYVVTGVAAGDINNDGKTDLVLSAQEVLGTSLQTAGILLITGNGDGTFNPPSEIASDNYFFDVKLADMNNDGNADIVATYYSTPALLNGYCGMVTLLGYGNGGFAPPVNEFEGLDNTLALIGHFMNDGAMDVMNDTGFGAAFFVGQGGTTLSLGASTSSIVFGQTVTLTATLTPVLSGRPASTGTISFYDGSTLLDSAPLTSGAAVYTTSSLASGSHSIHAIYSGAGPRVHRVRHARHAQSCERVAGDYHSQSGGQRHVQRARRPDLLGDAIDWQLHCEPCQLDTHSRQYRGRDGCREYRRNRHGASTDQDSVGQDNWGCQHGGFGFHLLRTSEKGFDCGFVGDWIYAVHLRHVHWLRRGGQKFESSRIFPYRHGHSALGKPGEPADCQYQCDRPVTHHGQVNSECVNDWSAAEIARGMGGRQFESGRRTAYPL